MHVESNFGQASNVHNVTTCHASTVHLLPTAPVCMQSDGHRMRVDAFRTRSEAIRGDQRPSEAIKCNL